MPQQHFEYLPRPGHRFHPWKSLHDPAGSGSHQFAIAALAVVALAAVAVGTVVAADTVVGVAAVADTVAAAAVAIGIAAVVVAAAAVATARQPLQLNRAALHRRQIPAIQ